MQFINPPIKIAPLPDESPTSWLVRISIKYNLSLRDLVSIYMLEEWMKQSVNISADLSPLSIILPERMKLPNTIKGKIESFEWKKGRSEWLIHPNKKGSALYNSYTRVCPKCLREKGYYQLKWQLKIITYCGDCRNQLIDNCPKCKRSISPILGYKLNRRIMEKSTLNKCHYCEFDLTKASQKELNSEEFERQTNINAAYSDNPINDRLLIAKMKL